MLAVSDALQLVLKHAAAKPAGDIDLADATGLVLGEDIVSDVDSPPHDKSLVDGYAVRNADFNDGCAKLDVLEEVTAGKVPSISVTPGHATRIMTGAPIPERADAVVMLERTTFSPAAHGQRTLGAIEINDPQIRAGQNIIPRGKSMRRGDVVLKNGAVIGPAEIGLLAEIGRAKIRAIGPVSVAILSTGNELVPGSETPEAGQIRNSNGPLLVAAAKRVGAAPVDLGIARDDVAELRSAISKGLKSDVLIISGGVSAGVLDLVPKVLGELGVEQVFHKINLKPGKPLWFGTSAPKNPATKTPRPTTLVFGLPGNPISSLVCFELFVKPAIAKISGWRVDTVHRTKSAKLARDFVHRGDRPTYYPAVLNETADGATVEPNRWQGSADLRGFTGANALIAFEAGERSYEAGETVQVLPL